MPILPDVVTTVPVSIHISFPVEKPSLSKGSTSIGIPTKARRNSTNARLIKTKLEGVRICNISKLECVKYAPVY